MVSAKKFKVIAIGYGAVGKSSLLIVLNNKRFPDHYVPNIFDNYTQYVNIDGNSYEFYISDTNGQDEFDHLCPYSYSGVNAFLLCFSLESKDIFSNLTDKWIEEIKHTCKDAKIILIGTKLDLLQEDNENHVIYQEANRFVAEQNCSAFIACSSKTGEGIDKIFPAIAKACYKDSKNSCLLI